MGWRNVRVGPGKAHRLPPSGLIRPKPKYGRTRAEAKAKVDDLQRKAEMGIASLTRDQTFAVYLDHWLHDVAGPAIRPSTSDSYESAIRVRILPDLGNVKLSKITPQQLQALYRRLAEKGLSPASIVRTHAILHSALKQAMLWNLIPRNPADAVRPPSIVRRELQILSREQVQRLIEGAADEALRTLYAVAATAGLRRGELLGLRWSDIDLDRRLLTVQRTAQRVKQVGIVYGGPKTHAGRRSIRLGALAIAHRRAHRTAHLEQRVMAGPGWHDSDLVVTSGSGRGLEQARVTRSFQVDLTRAGLPRVRLPDLRHTAATVLFEEGVGLKVVQAALGHSTIATTMDVYAHVTPAMQNTVGDAMDRLFGSEHEILPIPAPPAVAANSQP